MHKRTLMLLLGVALVALAGCGGGSGGGVVSTHAKLSHSKGAVDDYVSWEESADNPLVPPGATQAARAKGDNHSSFPCVVQNPTTGQLLMWTDKGDWGGIYLRTSDDGGANWANANSSQPCSGLLSGARHARVVYRPDLGSYEMWYWNNTGDNELRDSWYHAVSTDGITWTGNATCTQQASPHRLVYYVASNVSQSVSSQGPCSVLYNPAGGSSLDYENLWNNKYVMYYHFGRGGSYGLGVAVSSDGLSWGAPAEGQMVLRPGGSGTWDSVSATGGAVFKKDGMYHMYYAGGTGIFGGAGLGYASSLDGLTWVKSAANPFLSINDGVAWRARYLGPPSALLVSGQRTLFIYSSPKANLFSVGIARIPDRVPPETTLAASATTIRCAWRATEAQVTITGSAVDDKSGVASATLTVTDEYGTANQQLDLTSLLDGSGAFSQELTLNASISGTDSDDSRAYVITLGAVDGAGNVATDQSITVTCLRVDEAPPSLALAGSTSTLWPPTGDAVPVTFTGSAVDSESGLATATLGLVDEYGKLDQQVDLLPLLNSADGSFSQVLDLVASRLGSDSDGRAYTLTISAADKRGNAATPVTITVVCPRGQAGGNGNGNGHKK